jgi:amphi-Trp domain-containing protein
MSSPFRLFEHMMKTPKHRDIQKTYSAAQFAAKLRRLADAVETGRAFTIDVAGERLRIPASARFNVEHERGGTSEELEFQLTWKTTRQTKMKSI